MAANKFAGKCAVCGATVPAQAGTITKTPAGWAVSHNTGGCIPGAAPTVAEVEFAPTDEQAAIIAAVLTGATLGVEAFAGAGKTATLRLIAKAIPHLTIGYTAFNKAIVTDGQGKFGSNASAQTFHKMAKDSLPGALAAEFMKRVSAPRMNSGVLATTLGCEAVAYTTPNGKYEVPRTRMAEWTGLTVSRWLTSDRDDVVPADVFKAEGIELVLDGEGEPANWTDLRNRLLGYARKMVRDLADPKTSKTMTKQHAHGCYLKAFAMSGLALPFDVLMVDEAQDLDPVMLRIIDNTAKAGVQIVLVGDSCQPTGTTVTVPVDGPRLRGDRTATKEVPIESLKAGDKVVSYDIAHSHLRMTGSRVAGVSSRPFQGDLIVATHETGATRYTPNHHCFVRFGQAIPKSSFIVYCMRRGDNFRVGVTSWRFDSQGGRLGLSVRAGQERADQAWILGVYPTQAAALHAERMAAWSFGVPDVCFEGTIDNRKDITEFWSSHGSNRDAAERLLKSFGRDIAYPIWSTEDGGQRRGFLSMRRPFITRACNLIDGMEVLPLTGAFDAYGKRVSARRWVPITVTAEAYDGLVWSMTVENDHTYIGDGIVTHNCQAIYEWRGAVNALALFGARPGVVTLRLTQSFRFGPEIAGIAQVMLSALGCPAPIVGAGQPGAVGTVTDPDAVLCRTNSAVIRFALDSLKAGKKVGVVGGVTEIVRFAEACTELKAGRRTNHADLQAFESWAQVQDYAGSDAGADLKLLVDLIDSVGAEVVLADLARCGDHTTPGVDVVVGTTHKTKGLEWKRVALGGDWKTWDADNEYSQSDLRVLYVACTRAKTMLDTGAVFAKSVANGVLHVGFTPPES